MHLKSSSHDWIFILYHLTHLRQKSQVSYASQKRTFKVLCHQPLQSLWLSCHRYKMFAFIHLSEVPMEFPHDQNQQRLGGLHQHLGTWVRNTHHFHSDYYLGNTKKMIHTIFSHGREETNSIFNYLNPSLMTHISLEHFQDQLLFSSNKQQLPIQKNKQHWQTRFQQNHSTIKELVKRKELGFFFALPSPSKAQNLRSSVDLSLLAKVRKLTGFQLLIYAYLSLILAVFARISLDMLLQQTVHYLSHLISAILAGFYLSPCFAWTHSCVISAANTNKMLIQSQKQEDITN